MTKAEMFEEKYVGKTINPLIVKDGNIYCQPGKLLQVEHGDDPCWILVEHWSIVDGRSIERHLLCTVQEYMDM